MNLESLSPGASQPSEDSTGAEKSAEQKDYLGWDLCRYIYVARSGYAAGYLSRDEAWSKIMPVARRLQRAFSSWQDLGADYLAGRYVWAGVDDPSYEYIYHLLCNQSDPNSPWTRSAWNTPLEDNPAPLE